MPALFAQSKVVALLGAMDHSAALADASDPQNGNSEDLRCDVRRRIRNCCKQLSTSPNAAKQSETQG